MSGIEFNFCDQIIKTKAIRCGIILNSTETWSGGGVFGTLFDPSVVMPGTIWLAYTVGLGGCTAASETAFTVYPVPAEPDVISLANGGFLAAGAEGLNVTWWIDGVEETAWENLTEIPTQPGASTIQVSVSNAYDCSATSEAWQAVAVTDLKAPLERPTVVRFNLLGQWMPNTRFQQPHMLLLPR